MRLLLKICLYASFWIYPGQFWGQDLRNFPVEKMTMEQGLPTNEVFHIVEGHEGYIWMATSNGLCKYNGQNHVVFDSQDGLPTSSVYHLFPQDDSSIVGVCSNAAFFRIRKDSISLILHPDTSSKYIQPLKFPYSFQIDSSIEYHIGTRLGYYHFNNESTLIEADTVRSAEFRDFILLPVENNKYVIYNRPPATESIWRSNAALWLGEKELAQCEDSRIQLGRSVYFGRIGQHFYVPASNTIFDFNLGTGKTSILNKEIDCIGIYAIDNLLFICADKGGMYCFELVGDELVEKYQLLNNFSISSISKSEECIYWISTLEDGVRKINTSGSEIVYQAPIDENITSFGLIDSTFIVGFDSGKIYNKKIGFKQVSINAVYDILLDERRYIVSAVGSYELDHSGALRDYSTKYNFSPSLNLLKQLNLNDSIRVGISIRGFYLMDKNRKLLKSILPEESNIEFLDLFLIDGMCYVSTNNSVMLIDPFVEARSDHIPIESKPILIFKHGAYIYALSYDSEIYQLREGKFELLLDSQEKIMGNSLSACYSNGLLAITSNKGVYVFKLNDGSHGVFASLIELEPIPLGVQVSLTDEFLYFSTPGRLYKKSIKDFSVEYPYIDEVKVETNEKRFNNTSLVDLEYDQNNIRFNINNVSLSEPFKRYKYKLEGWDQQFYSTAESVINYDNLAPGNYVFKVSATSDGYNYSPEKDLKITIASPFWMTWWFWSLLLLTISLITFWLINIRIRQIKTRSKLKESISLLKAQALSAQLNPHLVFNVMNSIQGMVSEGHAEKANIYISRFSKYLRTSLKQSRLSSITLDEELQMIEQYLELEKLRFQDQLNYSLDIGMVNLKIDVPALIIQPIVENAIKHGIRPSIGQAGQIDINVREDERTIIIKISDNGVGFSKTHHNGDGMRITKERLKVISESNSVEIIHAVNPTIVQIKIVK